MAGKYIEIKIDDQETILVDITPTEGLFQAGGEDVIEKAEGAFEQAMSTIQSLAKGFVTHVVAFPGHIRPQEVELEFGVTFKSEVGAIVAKASGEANLTVTLTWKAAGPKPTGS